VTNMEAQMHWFVAPGTRRMTDYRDRRTRAAAAVAGRLYDRRTSYPTAAAEDRLGIAAFAETADMQLRQERGRCGIEAWVVVVDVKERSADEAAARDSDCSERGTQSPEVHAAYDPYCMGLVGP